MVFPIKIVYTPVGTIKCKSSCVTMCEIIYSCTVVRATFTVIFKSVCYLSPNVHNARYYTLWNDVIVT